MVAAQATPEATKRAANITDNRKMTRRITEAPFLLCTLGRYLTSRCLSFATTKAVGDEFPMNRPEERTHDKCLNFGQHLFYELR
jgi:hypothetical protein